MVFKGTSTRTASELAADMDRIGGQVNAFTSKELTCFHARALDSHLPSAIGILCDMFFDPKLSSSDVELEKSVILEEIGMYEDTPEDKVSELLLSSVFKDSPLGMPVLGTPSNVKRFSASLIRSYMKSNYRPQDTVVSLSGSFSDSDIDYLTKRF
jgi:predicted Zn-dependent peptidase